MMASVIAKKHCAKCDRSGITTCDGCERSLCAKHFTEHRQELAVQMNGIGQEHELLQRDLIQENDTHPFLSHIDNWERESINKIQVAAEAARNDLRQIIDRTKNDLNSTMSRMTEELKSSQESGDYMEIDLKRWIDELNELRKKFKTPPTLYFSNDIRELSCIRLIKVTELEQTGIPFEQNIQTYQELIHFGSERFDEAVGEVTLSEENLVATFARYSRFSADICGVNRYSSGMHEIRFRIDRKGPHDLVLGIMTSSQEIIQSSLAPSVYGWWDLDCPIVNGMGERLNDKRTIKEGDQLTLILDCDNRKIELQHHRSKRFVHLLISFRTCPLPWKLLVGMYSEGDCIRILHQNEGFLYGEETTDDCSTDANLQNS